MKLTYALPTALLLIGSVGTIAYFTSAQSPPSQPFTLTPVSLNTLPEQPSLPTGGLFVQSPTGQQVFPLKHTEVAAKIAGNISRVEVTQTFENPFKNPLEAVYVFPLPDESAVDDLEIKIGDRIIKGDIKKREEAKEIYERARQAGRTASLLEQERDNIFTQSLANIKPGEQIQVTIRYTDSLKFEKGDYEFVFPMVVGPRYIPGSQIEGSNGDTDQVPDASRINPPIARPGTRSGHDINVTVDIDAGVAIAEVHSPSHQIRIERPDNSTGFLKGFAQTGHVQVKLGGEDTIPNKDLILRYRVANNNTQATVLTQSDEKGGHFATYLIPALDYRSNEIVPKDVVFLMDTSGSQQGDPLAKSQELMRQFINGLNPNDTFSIIDFANTTQQLSAAPLPNTPANRAKAMAYINQLNANGGTELLNGIRTVLNFSPAPEGRLRSVVLLTDGYIGNDNEVIAEVQRQLKPGNRLYSFGVGSSVNRFLLNRLAEVGRGTSQVIRQDEPTQAVAEKFFRQINNPVLTNIQVSWEGSGQAPEIYPLAAPDLFANQPLVLFGRKLDRTPGSLHITGIAAGGKRYEKTLNVNFNGNNPGIAQLWGRARIKDLMNQMFGGEVKSGVEAVTNTALAYHLVSAYTALVAVSEEVRVNPDGTQQKVQVPVELPQGVSYQGTVGKVDQAAQRSNIASAPAPIPQPLGALQRRIRATAPSASDSAVPPVPLSPGRDRTQVGIAPRQEAAPASESAKTANRQQVSSRMQVIQADGLDAVAIASLTQHLQGLNLALGVGGEITLDLPVSNGRVSRVILDDQNSTLRDPAIIDLIKRQLLSWQVPSGLKGTIHLKLKVTP
jgi:Ca-activated chloride channel family protein